MSKCTTPTRDLSFGAWGGVDGFGDDIYVRESTGRGDKSVETNKARIARGN